MNLRLYKLCDFSFREGSTPVRVTEPPAGPPKLTYSSPEVTFSKILVIRPDLELGRSQAVEFSWTSSFQNLKLHAFISNLTASRQDLTTR